MTLPPCGEAACDTGSGSCVARPRQEGLTCSSAVCVDAETWQPPTTCEGLSTVCERPPASIGCPAGTCEVGRCAELDGAAACYTRKKPSASCSMAGQWWVVWWSTNPCRGDCEGLPNQLLASGVGTLDVDADGRGLYAPISGGGARSFSFEDIGADSRVHFSSDLDVDWRGWSDASGDLVVASRPGHGGFWWMVRKDSAATFEPSRLQGTWNAVLIASGFNYPWRIIGGQVTFDERGCLTGTNAGTQLFGDGNHLFSPVQVATAACATTTATGRLRFPLLEVDRDSGAGFEGILSRDESLGVFTMEFSGFWGPDTLVLVRAPEEPAGELRPMAGDYGFVESGCSNITIRLADTPPAIQTFVRTTFGGVRFDASGDGGARAFTANENGAFDTDDWPDARGRVRADGTFAIDLLPEQGGGLTTHGHVVDARASWPAAPLLVAYPQAGDGKPLTGELSVFVWIEDADVLENPVDRTIVPLTDD